ncbi:MAG: DMT family transporter [Sinobacterium sp.]|nr:DMT family transporter [Sinobacterium sp.]
MSTAPASPSAPFIYAFFMSLVAATATAALKYLGADVSIAFITFWQFVLCLLISLWVLYKKRIGIQTILAIEKSDRIILLVRGVSGLLGFYAFYSAVSKIPLVDATLLRHSSPLFVPIISLLWFGVKTPWRTVGFILLGFMGVYIALQPDVSSVKFYHLVGLSSAVFLALSMVSTNHLKKYDSSIVLFYYFFISCIGMLPFAISHWQSVSLLQAGLMLYIGLSIYIAMYLYNKAFTLSSAALISPMTYLAIVHAGFLGWLIWGYIPTTISIVGMLIVVICGLVTTWLSTKNRT